MGLEGPGSRAAARTALAAVCGALTLAACTGAADPAAPGSAVRSPQQDDPRPNLVMVLVDDLGWGDLGTGRLNGGHPNRFVDTPAIDRLVADGTAFPDGYGALSCAPSRMALLTGRYPQRPANGVYGGLDPDAVAGSYDGPPPRLRGVENRGPTRRSRLADETVTVPELMAAAGYWSAHVGKFDVTRDPADITAEHGYDVNRGGTASASPASYVARPRRAGRWTWGRRVSSSLDEFAEPYTRDYLEDNVVPYSTGVPEDDVLALAGTPKHLTDAIGDAAVRSIDEGAATGGPFAVQVNPYAVHSPVAPEETRPDLLRKYRQRSRPGDGRVPAYAGLVEGVDQTVGRVLDHLRQQEDPRAPGRTLAENSVVVLMSDNGGRIRYNGTSDRRVGGDNGPLRGEKMQVWEGGIRVPTAAWSGDPRLVRPGVVNRSIVHVTDVAATFADYARVPDGERRRLDGESLRATLAGRAAISTPLLSHHPAYSLGKGRDERPASVFRSGRWVVRFDYEGQRLRLYDLAREPSQRTDVADARPALARRLGRAMAAELARLDTPLATLRRRYAPQRLVLGPGSVTYADGRVRRYDARTVRRVRAGDEMPFVVR